MDIITKTLYIRIDDTPMPLTQPELAKLVPTVDCRMLNDFYSIFGDALCGDLTAHDGRPLYRLITPAGRILAEYAASDGSAEALADLRQQWYDLLVGILDGSAAPTYTFTLPAPFRRWLERHPNDLYHLLASQTSVTLTSDIISEIYDNANKIINTAKKYFISDIVYSTPHIFSKQKDQSMFPISIREWATQINGIFYEIEQERKKHRLYFNNPQSFYIDSQNPHFRGHKLTLGKSIIFDFSFFCKNAKSVDSDSGFYYLIKHSFFYFRNKIWHSIYASRDPIDKSINYFEHFFYLATHCRISRSDKRSFNYLLPILIKLGYTLSLPPTSESKSEMTYFRAVFTMETIKLRYELCFLSHCSKSLQMPLNKPGTLYSIKIEVK
ncbi:MAG: hypothetical protein NC241_03610 [Bacteroides sp.]|nr:hypothetical protein [Bacteroides sp.]MCM1457919.1 hypothetical protein [Lachnoclostridium sp.]